MPLFLITGPAGTGKSTTGHALKAKGYETYDADEDGLTKWQNNKTGYIYPKSSIKKEQRTSEFLREHSWNFPRQEAEALAAKAIDKPIFLCGALANEDELLDLFAMVFALYVDEDTLVHRLTTRTTGDWGKQPHELQHTLDHYHGAYKKYRRLSYTVVDTSQPVEAVVDTILHEANV